MTGGMLSPLLLAWLSVLLSGCAVSDEWERDTRREWWGLGSCHRCEGHYWQFRAGAPVTGFEP